MNNIVPPQASKPIQQTRETPNVSTKGPGPEKGFREHNQSVSQKVPAKLGRPNIVTRAGESGSYALDKLNGTLVPRMWNVMHLKRYYQ